MKSIVRYLLLTVILIVTCIPSLYAQRERDNLFSLHTGGVVFDSHFEGQPFVGSGVTLEPRIGSDIFFAVGFGAMQSKLTANYDLYFKVGYEFKIHRVNLTPYFRTGVMLNRIYKGCCSGYGLETGLRVRDRLVLFLAPEFIYNLYTFSVDGPFEYGILGSLGLRYLFL